MSHVNSPNSAQSQSDVARPIANFHPCVWGDQFLNCLANHEETVAKWKNELESLKSDVRRELLKMDDKPLEQLKLIDTIERLGVAYCFEKEIEDALKQMYDAYKGNLNQENHLDLYHTCLRFRILRQHGYYVSSDIFSRFTDEHGSFIESLKIDVAGLLSLYDAAYLRGNGETILEKAVEFTTLHLKAIVAGNSNPLTPQIARALLYPIHKGVISIESRHFISFYEQDPSHMASLLRLFKLEFDIRQSLHKEELQQLTKWWRNFDFRRKLPYTRDRVVESYLFSVAIFHDPKLSAERTIYTKAFMLIASLDDTYDSYGTTEELEAFTKAIERWDKSCTDELPSRMNLFYGILYDSIKQFGLEVAKMGVKNNVQYVVHEVIQLSKAYMEEARWRKAKYVPEFNEYLENGIRSSAIAFTVSVSMLINNVEEIAAEKTFESVSNYCKPIRATCIIGRLMDDLYDYKWDKHRDHVVGGVDCYIKQHGVSEEEAFIEINLLIENAWKDMNEEIFHPITPFATPLLPYLYNFCRGMDFLYKMGNGLTNVNQHIKDVVELLFINPLSI